MKLARRVLVIVGLTFLSILVFSVTASANGGPHGGYTDLLTNACAGCHRAHTAPAEALVAEDSIYQLCYSCHGDGSGALTNVWTGQVGSSRLNGGGFQSVGGTAASSVHDVKGLGGSLGQGTAWGGDNAGTGLIGVLECTSCHNPHGSTNYRILRDADNGLDPTGSKSRWVTGALPWASNQVVSTNDEPTDVVSKYAAGDTAYYTQGMNDLCANCHKQYLTNSGSARNPSTDATYYVHPGTQDANDGKGDIARYRHALNATYNDVPDLPMRLAPLSAGGATRNGLTCLTCHFAHGTASVASGVPPTNDSALLYYNGRGVCRSCHQKTK